MRNEWEAAEALCLQALRIDAEDPEPHRILGDIFLAKNQPEDAQRWYELALELNPTSTIDREKLVIVRQKLLDSAEADQMERAKSSPKDGTGIWTAAFSILLLVSALGVVGYSLLGPKAGGRPTVSVPISIPVVIQKPETIVAPKIEPQLPLADRNLRTRIAQISSMPNSILGALHDPRDKSVIVSVELVRLEEAKAIAANVGRASLIADPDLEVATVRCVLEDRVVFIGEFHRSRYQAALRGRSELSIDLLMGVLSNEWTPGSPPKPRSNEVVDGRKDGGLLQ